jgi:hypothetical protein
MTSRKKESALGRGLDALIRPEVINEELDETEKSQSKPKISSSKNGRKNNAKTASKIAKKNENIKKNSTQSTIESKNKNKSGFDETLIENVILEVHKNPRISLWSAKSAAVLRLLKKTKPEFSISKEASALIEEAVKDKYPDIWEVFEDRNLKN